MSEIRPAVISDLPRLERMGAEFFTVACLDRWFTYKPRCFSQVCANFMTSENAVILVGEVQGNVVAMASALAYQCWFDAELLVCQEVFWWVDPLHRGSLGPKLMRQLEDWAREHGCHTMEVAAMEASRPEAMERLYERRGYEPKERNFCKVLRS